MAKKNQIYNEDCITGIPAHIERESIDLVIADPPYFKVIKEAWDYKWRTESDYLEWSCRWINKASEALRKGGSFYLFGYFRTLSELLPVCEKYGLELRQQIVINKGIKAISGRATKAYKMFPTVTESILFFVKDSKPFVQKLLKSRQQELGLSSKSINEALGVKANGGGIWSIFTGKNICAQVPTLELWNRLQDVLKFSFPYDKISQTWNTQMGLSDVWNDIDFYEEKKRIHPTQKPLKLIERPILASSNPSDTVLDPFMGSGTTAVACTKLNRNYVGFEVSEDYYNLSLKRIRQNDDPANTD